MTVTKVGPDPRPGDILLFFRAHRGRDYLIKLVTRSRYYHAALYVGDGKIIEARPRGVAVHDLKGRETAYTVLPAPQGKGTEALAWAKQHIGDGYDRVDMLVILLEHVFTRLHINYAPYDKWTCGEFVAAAFEHAGLHLFPDRELDDVTPADFARLLTPAAHA